ncbi:LPXTG cell wall anchor domain-containing protein [Streptococcus sp. X16XC17]|uniref:LPXTG cell wall anchor domain-containing protein n=1 Tax=Streptococcus sp. X13SY08 TaxID=1676616 RepID=UPI0010405014|nr:LPXTG cell wall anchor domain-containing protein [Streptococcus sp. X16XC17]
MNPKRNATESTKADTATQPVTLSANTGKHLPSTGEHRNSSTNMMGAYGMILFATAVGLHFSAKEKG